MKTPMARDKRSLEAIYKDFGYLGEQYNDLTERQRIMTPKVREKILDWIFSFANSPDGRGKSAYCSTDYVLCELKRDLQYCAFNGEQLFTDTELRRLANQVISYYVEEQRKPAEKAFREGSIEDFLSRQAGEDSKSSIAGNLRELTRTVKSWNGAATVGFGIPLLDSSFKGIYPGEIGTLIGAPSTMKTSLAVNAAIDYMARSDGACLFCECDMEPYELTERLALRECELSTDDFRRQLTGGTEKALFAMKTVEQKYNRLFITGNTPNEPMTLERLFQDVLAKGVSFVVVDYLTRLKPENTSDLIFTEKATNRIHRFAAANKVTFLVLSQMSRDSRKTQAEGGDSFSRGSGVVEELSAVVIALRLHKMPPDGDGIQGDMLPIVATVEKARHGIRGGQFWLERDAPNMRFTGKASRVQLTSSRKPTIRLEAIGGYNDILTGG